MRLSISVVCKKLSRNNEFYASRSGSRTLLNKFTELLYAISIFLWLIWVKFVIEYLHVTPLEEHEVPEKRFNVIHNLQRGVKEILPSALRLSPDLNEIWYNRGP